MNIEVTAGLITMVLVLVLVGCGVIATDLLLGMLVGLWIVGTFVMSYLVLDILSGR